MRRSEATQAYQAFLSLRDQVLAFRGRIDQSIINQREQLWSLCEQLRENIEVFNEEEKEQILSINKKVLFPTPLLRNFRRQSRSRSVGDVSSVGSASFLSADMSNTDGESLATLMEAKLAMEEEMEKIEREQRRKMEDLEAERRKMERDRKRELIARAAASGISFFCFGSFLDLPFSAKGLSRMPS